MNQIPVQLPDLDYAPKWQRVIHFLVDGMLAYACGVALLWLLFLVASPADWFAPFFEWLHTVKRRWIRWSFMLVYYLAAEVGFGTTVGKLLTRTAVCDAEGRQPTRLRLLGRTLARFIPFDPFSFFGRDGTGWHDAASKTYVIRKASVKPHQIPA